MKTVQQVLNDKEFQIKLEKVLYGSHGNLVGKRFGKYEVCGFAGTNRKGIYWRALCSKCGEIVNMSTKELIKQKDSRGTFCNHQFVDLLFD